MASTSTWHYQRLFLSQYGNSLRVCLEEHTRRVKGSLRPYVTASAGNPAVSAPHEASAAASMPSAALAEAPRELRFVDGPMPDDAEVIMAKCNALERSVLWLSGYGGTAARQRRAGVHLARACASAGSGRRLHELVGLAALPPESAAAAAGGSFRRGFAMQSVHVWMLLRHFRALGVDTSNEELQVEAGAVSQELYDSFMEVTEKSASTAIDFMVPNRWAAELERMFYGAALKYDEAIDAQMKQTDADASAAMLNEGDGDALSDALLKNVIGVQQQQDAQEYDGERRAAERECARQIARYVRREIQCLQLTNEKDLLAGNLRFSLDDEYELFVKAKR